MTAACTGRRDLLGDGQVCLYDPAKSRLPNRLSDIVYILATELTADMKVIHTMRCITLCFVAVTMLFLGGCATVAPPAPAGWTPLFVGVSHKILPAPGPEPMIIQALRVDLKAGGVSLFVTPGDPSAGHEYRALTSSAALTNQGWQAAVNGGYFLPFSGGSPGGDDYVPQPGQGTDVTGAAVQDGRTVSPVETDLDKRVNAIICIWKRAKVRIRDGQVCGPSVRDAMAAGPRLLADGEPLSFAAFDLEYNQGRHPRTAVGLDARNQILWLVTVDGRQPAISLGASLTEMTAILQGLGAANAINLDGGGSTTMVVQSPTGPKRLNVPIHTGIAGRERPVANHLGVKAQVFPTIGRWSAANAKGID